jgi:hypothetical protein
MLAARGGGHRGRRHRRRGSYAYSFASRRRRSPVPTADRARREQLLLGFALWHLGAHRALHPGLMPALFSSDVSPATRGRRFGRAVARLAAAKTATSRACSLRPTVALALMLLAGAGGPVAELRPVSSASVPGFVTRGVRSSPTLVAPVHRVYATGVTPRADLFYDALLRSIARPYQALTLAAATNTPPLSWGPNEAVLAEDSPEVKRGSGRHLSRRRVRITCERGGSAS